jgi:hypothetical protein
MNIDYEIVWMENDKMNFQQFSYEMDDAAIPVNSRLPDDLYKFYVELQNKKVPIYISFMLNYKTKRFQLWFLQEKNQLELDC